jgi:hypothetical protein
VIRGNLMVIPLENSVLYVEPLFLQAQQSQLPELTRVIATFGQQIVMEPTLEDAMMALIQGSGAAAAGEEPAAEVGEEPGAEPAAELGPPSDAEVDVLARGAKAAYDRAVAAQRRGDWAAYGAALAELGRILERMSVSQ